MQVDDEALVARITARSTCGACGEVYNDDTSLACGWQMPNCGAPTRRRADDNEESLETRLMAYYKQTSRWLAITTPRAI